jgi:hypothetical protein
MADARISDLTALTTPASTDVLAIVDVDVNTTKKITVANLLAFAETLLTQVVTYPDLLAADVDGFLVIRIWQDETVSAFVTPEGAAPRSCTVSITPGIGTVTGTATINGTNADGTVIQEVLTINDAVPTKHETDRAFSTITSIVIDRTDASTTPRYSFGWGDRIGLPNGPLGAAGDVKKAAKNGAKIAVAGYTINTTYATFTPVDAVVGGDDFVFFIRSS